MTGKEWMAGYLSQHDIDWDKLTAAERFKLTMLIPCTIRCFRIGDAVDVKPGEDCPECGHEVPLLTSWEKIPLGI